MRRTFLANRAHASGYLFDVEDRRTTSDRWRTAYSSRCSSNDFLKRLEISNSRLRKNGRTVGHVRENGKEEKRREMNDMHRARNIRRLKKARRS